MKTVCLVLILSCTTLVNAQTGLNVSPTESKEAIQQVNEAKPNSQAFANSTEISKALDISESEAKNVWIVYEDYNRSKQEMKDKHKDIAKRYRAASESKEMTDEQYEAGFRSRLQAKRDRLDLDETYYNKFLEILPASKVQIMLLNERKAQREGIEKRSQQVRTQERLNQSR